MMWLTGIIQITLPFIRSFELLVIARLVQNVVLGAYITADASLIVYTMGPTKSRPFTNALHAVIGVGFLLATFLVRPFLPEKNIERVCPGDGSQPDEDVADFSGKIWGVDKINWPFLISGIWTVCFATGYVILSKLFFILFFQLIG